VKHYSKKREMLGATQWTGEMTPDVTELTGQRKVHVEGDRQLILGNGWYARVGDWIMSTPEGVSVIGDEVFRRIYEEVDETGRVVTPTDDEHEAAGREFVRELDALLVATLRLSREEHPSTFRDRDALVRNLRHLLEDHAYVAVRRELARIRVKITKELWP
jgi:hypothetical protein